MTADLFDSASDVLPSREQMADGAVLLRGFARMFKHKAIPSCGEPPQPAGVWRHGVSCDPNRIGRLLRLMNT